MDGVSSVNGDLLGSHVGMRLGEGDDENTVVHLRFDFLRLGNSRRDVSIGHHE
jgi:hypothetical protein